MAAKEIVISGIFEALMQFWSQLKRRPRKNIRNKDLERGTGVVPRDKTPRIRTYAKMYNQIFEDSVKGFFRRVK